ncbi:MAG: DMT family transporter [Actinomycetota bacterium]|jgi:transporter family-2 protein|nr:DMT family transporter [Rubrobacter sp.]MBA3790059.1 DMT family transporter [Rubrobacter sp.]MDQ3568431.1 DMT family transporter [Actinomycetota bacterium]
MSWLLFLPMPIAAGAALTTQFAVNAQLRTVVGGPVVAAAISFFIGTLALVAAALVVGRQVPEMSVVTSSPWWVWIGGLLGAAFVLASIILTPRLGAATTIGLFLAGQMIASIIIDHFGLLRVAVHEATIPRIVGLMLVLLGVFLVQKF